MPPEIDLRTRLDAKRPGDEATVTAVLWGRLRDVRVVLGVRPSTDFRFRKLPHADAAARAIAASWLGRTWEELIVSEHNDDDDDDDDLYEDDDEDYDFDDDE